MTNPLKPGQHLTHIRDNHSFTSPRKGRVLGVTVLQDAVDPTSPGLMKFSISICSHQELNFSRKIGFAQARQFLESEEFFYCAEDDFDYAREMAVTGMHKVAGLAEVMCNLSWAGRLQPVGDKSALQLMYLSKEYGYRISEELQFIASSIIREKQIKDLPEEAPEVQGQEPALAEEDGA